MTDRPLIIVSGSRKWLESDPVTEQIRKDLQGFPTPSVLLHGACPAERGGADWIADGIARDMGWIVFPVAAINRLDGEWPGAGPVRTARMFDEAVRMLAAGYVTRLFGLIYPKPKTENRGTRHAYRICKREEIPMRVWPEAG